MAGIEEAGRFTGERSATATHQAEATGEGARKGEDDSYSCLVGSTQSRRTTQRGRATTCVSSHGDSGGVEVESTTD